MRRASPPAGAPTTPCFAGAARPRPGRRRAKLDGLTNRDLYIAITDLARAHAAEGLPLDAFLARLHAHARRWRDRDALAPAAFVALLAAALTVDAPLDDGPGPATPGFLAWEERLRGQRADLAQLAAAGRLDDEYRYFGIDAASGVRWYNFDPGAYLECAVTGSFGGWEEGDDTGRTYVPGGVVVLDADGALTSVDPRDIEAPVVELADITWEVFGDFLACGASYE